jgi:hypothetical protein
MCHPYVLIDMPVVQVDVRYVSLRLYRSNKFMYIFFFMPCSFKVVSVLANGPLLILLSKQTGLASDVYFSCTGPIG